MDNIIAFVTAHWEDILAIYGAVVAACTTTVKLTPSKKDDSVWGNIVKVLDFFSTAFTDSDAAKLAKKK